MQKYRREWFEKVYLIVDLMEAKIAPTLALRKLANMMSAHKLVYKKKDNQKLEVEFGFWYGRFKYSCFFSRLWKIDAFFEESECLWEELLNCEKVFQAKNHSHPLFMIVRNEASDY